MQKDLAPDIELNLKKRARRRLVGALALVLILAILLPFLLKDRSTEVSNDHVEIALQSNETAVQLAPNDTLPDDFDSKVVPTGISQTETSQPETITEAPVALPAPEKPKVADKPKTNTKQTATKTTNKPVVSEPEKPKPTPVKPKQPTKVKTPEKVKTKPQQKPKADSKAGYVVQVGAFADAEKVKTLQSKMRELGYGSHTENVKTEKGVLVRLQSQTFASRNEAVIALQNMKDAGLSGMVRAR